MANLYEARDFSLPVTVYTDDTKTVVIPASGYNNAQYRIYRTGTCELLVSKSLSNGIINTGDTFVIVFIDTDINFSGTVGEYSHSLAIGKNEFELLPDLFNEAVSVISACNSIRFSGWADKD
jgi:hypothetical protein